MADYLAPAERIVPLRDLGAKATVVIGRTNLLGANVVNNQAAIIFVQLFDALLANVTLGTTTPDYEFQVAASSSAQLPMPVQGLVFRTGIVAGSTTTEKGAAASAAGVEPFFFIGP